MPTQAAQALMAYAELRGGPHSRHHSQEKILINGSERGVVTFAGCCQPIPGDEIMGYHTAGKGIVVHRMDCPNLAELRKSPERWVPIGWDTTVSGDYDTSLVVEVENGTGVLAQLAAAIAQSHSNIERVDYRTATSTPPCWRSTSGTRPQPPGRSDAPPAPSVGRAVGTPAITRAGTDP